MRLSEAIRLGAMLKPQKYGPYIKGDESTCALYAACDAMGDLVENRKGYYAL